MPISLVLALTENARTPAIPTAAMSKASRPKDAINVAFNRRGDILSSLVSEMEATRSITAFGAMRLMIFAALLTLSVIFLPGGLVSIGRRLWRSTAGRQPASGRQAGKA